MLNGLLPIVVAILILVILLSAAKQLWRQTKLSKFIPWLLCCAFMIYAAKNLDVFESLGKSVWKVSSNLITHIEVPAKKE
jgi:hypothetical protein